MQFTANTTRRYDRRAEFQRRLEKASEWLDKPLIGAASFFVPAVVGLISFVFLFAVYMIA